MFSVNCAIVKIFLFVLLIHSLFFCLTFTDEPWKFNFEVKFYPPDPAQLQEDITRFVIIKVNFIY
jgi:hypothetical protein